jgi:hypothetical protein
MRVYACVRARVCVYVYAHRTSRCLREADGEGRCGEGLIQDDPKFADSRGKTRDDRRTMGVRRR